MSRRRRELGSKRSLQPTSGQEAYRTTTGLLCFSSCGDGSWPRLGNLSAVVEGVLVELTGMHANKIVFGIE